jgi:hypothetical protein
MVKFKEARRQNGIQKKQSNSQKRSENMKTNINDPKLVWNSDNHLDTLVTLDELEKVLKLTKNGKSPGEDNINSELCKYTLGELKLKLLKFLNNIYTENYIPNEWRNATVIPIFKKGDRRDPKNYRVINILHT